MIRKSGNRFSEKIMLKQRDEIMMAPAAPKMSCELRCLARAEQFASPAETDAQRTRHQQQERHRDTDNPLTC
jgi:hypothetical protein